MSIGLIIMVWNACELTCREILKTLASKGAWEQSHTVEALVSELGSVGITQALNCYVNEFPEDESALAAGLAHAAQIIEICRVYRNYYVHHISGVTRYGVDLSPEMIAKDPPLSEAITVGPFAKVYSKTAKGKMKFSLHFIKPEELILFNNYLADVHKYLQSLQTSIIHYFRKELEIEERAKAPQPLPLLSALKKPVSSLFSTSRRPALAPRTIIATDEDTELSNDGEF